MPTQMLLPLPLAFAVAGLVAVVGIWWTRRAPGAMNWTGALSLACGCAAGHVLLRGWPSFPVSERIDCLFYLALAAAMLQFGLSWRRRSPAITWLFRGAFWLLAVFWLLKIFSSRDKLGDAVEPAVAGGVWWWSLDTLSARMFGDGVSGPSPVPRSAVLSWVLPITIVLTGSMIVTVLSGTLVVALMQGVLLAAVTPLFVLVFLRPNAAGLLRSSWQVLAVLLAGTWIIGRYYSEVPPDCCRLLWVAAFFAWTSQAPPVKRARPWQGAVVATVLTAAIVGLAVGITVLRFMAAAPDPRTTIDCGFTIERKKQ